MTPRDRATLCRLLQLASPALPVGAYSYSQGLEWAVEAGWIHDEASTLAWIASLLEHNVGRNDMPLLAAMQSAWQRGDDAACRGCEAEFLATRESAELRAETLQMGHSMRRLIAELGTGLRAEADPGLDNADVGDTALPTGEISFALAWSWLAAHWRIDLDDALAAWAWSWAENQTMAALKAVPLGQAAGQRILFAVGARIPGVVARALALDDDERSNFAPGFAIASARHETQYTRLFRS